MTLGRALFVAALLSGCRSHSDPSADEKPAPAPIPPAPAHSASAKVAKPEAPKPPVFPTAADAPGPAVIAVEDGGVFVFDHGKLTNPEGKSRVSYIGQTHAGTVVIKSGFPDYVLAADGTVQKERFPFGPLAAAPDGTLWFLGASNELVHTQEGSADAPIKEKIPADEGEFVNKIAVAKNGDVYFASLGAFYRKRGAEWKSVKASDLVKTETQIQGLLPVGDDVYAVIGTAGYDIDGKKLALPPTTAMFAVYVQETPSVSPTGLVAFTTGLEYVVVTPEGKSSIKSVAALGVKGLSEASTIALDGQGRRWLGTDAGLVVLSKDDRVLQVWPPGTLNGEAKKIFVVGAGPELGADPPPVTTGNVTGRVLIDGQPLKSSDIMICDSPASVMTGPTPCSGKAAVSAGKTDDSGVFHFTDVPAWSYGFAMKTDSGWRVMLGSSLGQCCKNVDPSKEVNVGDVSVKTN